MLVVLTSAIILFVSPRNRRLRASSSLAAAWTDRFFKWMFWSESSINATFLFCEKHCVFIMQNLSFMTIRTFFISKIHNKDNLYNVLLHYMPTESCIINTSILESFSVSLSLSLSLINKKSYWCWFQKNCIKIKDYEYMLRLSKLKGVHENNVRQIL